MTATLVHTLCEPRECVHVCVCVVLCFINSFLLNRSFFAFFCCSLRFLYFGCLSLHRYVFPSFFYPSFLSSISFCLFLSQLMVVLTKAGVSQKWTILIVSKSYVQQVSVFSCALQRRTVSLLRVSDGMSELRGDVFLLVQVCVWQVGPAVWWRWWWW